MTDNIEISEDDIRDIMANIVGLPPAAADDFINAAKGDTKSVRDQLVKMYGPFLGGDWISLGR